VTRKEALSNPAAHEAVMKEWNKLRAQGVWDEKTVKPWAEVRAKAKRDGRTIHVGRIFDICVEKNHELPPSDPRRKFKGRVVFGGNNVRDQNSEAALFQDLGSSPATMEASKFCDMFSLLVGHSAQQADAVSAYTQAKLDSRNETWVRLPKHAWPASGAWERIADPVCPLRLALYGHPESGGYWEQYATEQVKAAGFRAVPNWGSCFFHPELRLFLIVYVDDFKLAGPTEIWRRVGG